MIVGLMFLLSICKVSAQVSETFTWDYGVNNYAAIGCTVNGFVFAFDPYATSYTYSANLNISNVEVILYQKVGLKYSPIFDSNYAVGGSFAFPDNITDTWTGNYLFGTPMHFVVTAYGVPPLGTTSWGEFIDLLASKLKNYYSYKMIFTGSCNLRCISSTGQQLLMLKNSTFSIGGS